MNLVQAKRQMKSWVRVRWSSKQKQLVMWTFDRMMWRIFPQICLVLFRKCALQFPFAEVDPSSPLQEPTVGGDPCTVPPLLAAAPANDHVASGVEPEEGRKMRVGA
eukprot:EG_transcript_39658